MFEHFRLLFLYTFQLNILLYIIPLSATLRHVLCDISGQFSHSQKAFRKNPYLLFTCLLIVVSIFSPYPSYAEVALYLPLALAFAEIHKCW